MKIKNKANNNTPKNFILSWESYEDNENIRSIQWVNVDTIDYNFNPIDKITIKFKCEELVNTETSITLGDSFFVELTKIIIFVKEYNSHYIASYSANWGNCLDSREVFEERLNFEKMIDGEYITKKYSSDIVRNKFRKDVKNLEKFGRY